MKPKKNLSLLTATLTFSLAASMLQAQSTPTPSTTPPPVSAATMPAKAKVGAQVTNALPPTTSAVIALKDPIAIVDGSKISKADLEKAFKEAVAGSGANPATLTADQKLQGYHQILDALIIEKLVDDKSAKTEISDAEVNAEIEKIKKQFPTPDAFDAELKKSGQTMDQFTTSLKKSMRQTKWVKSQLQSKDEVTDADAQKFYNDNIKQFSNPDMVKATHILFMVPPGASDKVVKEKEAAAKAAIARANKDVEIAAAKNLVQNPSKVQEVDAKLAADKATKAEDKAIKDEGKVITAEGDATKVAMDKASKAFSKLAMELSEEPGAKQRGGDLGFFSKTQMVPEFATAAFAQKIGSISELPVKTKFGYHVIMVTEKKPAGTATFAEVKPNIIAYLQNQKRREAFKAEMQQLRQGAKIENFLPAPAVITPASTKAPAAPTKTPAAPAASNGATTAAPAPAPATPKS